MKRLLLFFPMIFMCLWVGAPLSLLVSEPTTDVVLVQATSPGAMCWLGFATIISTAILTLDGWRIRANWSVRRKRFSVFSFVVLLFGLWFLAPAFCLGATLRQPPVIISTSTPLALTWLQFALIGSALTFFLLGKQLYVVREENQQRQQLLSLVDNELNEGIALFNRRLQLTWVNDSGKRYLIDKGQPHPDIMRLMQRALETGRVATQSFSVDERLRVNVQASPLSEGAVGLIARPLQNEDDPSNFYERFIRRIVHDMRNPLAAIIAHATNLHSAPESDSALWHNTAQTIENEAQRLTRLVDSMLFDARLSYVPLAAEKIDLVDVIEEVFFQYDERATRESKKIEIETLPAPVEIEADRDLLMRALSNLVDNSLKYSRAGSIIRIILEATESNFVLKVTDTGEGIPADYLPDRIFESLVRVRSKDGVSGSGLGLSIVKKIVELHGGSISVESVVGQGTTMIICLPK